ncbi:MAG: hypothetical protein EXR58_06825 [Chloroflexi bacterium]|nr:hypothetical protein [Chloroflexota bacterium]
MATRVAGRESAWDDRWPATFDQSLDWASGDFVEVAAVEDVEDGTLRAIEVDGQSLVLGNVDGKLYAVSGLCSHLGSKLALGSLHGPTLTCFAHLWTYDIRTGEPVWPPMARVAPGYRLRSHPVRIEGGKIWVSRRPGRRGLN